MLTIKTLKMNMLEENCYVVSDETKEAVVIDCGALMPADNKKLTDYVSENNLHILHHLCTHMHYDHCFGAAFMKATFGTAPEYDIKDEAIYQGQGSEFFGPLSNIMKEHGTPKATTYLNEGDEIRFGTHTLKVISTPGHTPGGICFYCEKERVLFAGDTLFFCSIGRTDITGGDTETLIDSIKNKLFMLPDDVKVYTGHGEATQIGFEKQNNPYV